MSDGAASLRTALQALQDELISEADYDQVKQAFVKAQQFKAGLDAGFLLKEDYDEVKRRFLDAFYDLSLSGQNAGARMAGAFENTDAPTQEGEGGTATPPEQSDGNSATALSAKDAQTAARDPSSNGANGVTGSQVRGGDRSGAAPAIPSNIPSLGGSMRKKTGPQTSMSGIAVTDDAINLFYYMKAKSAYRWAMWGVNNNGSEIVIVDVGEKDSSYTQFVERLPENDCRFAVYDYQVTNSEGRVFQKLVFLSWSPDTATIRTKMMYASSKDFLKSHMEGLAVELQVSGKDELAEEDIHEHVLSVLTRK